MLCLKISLVLYKGLILGIGSFCIHNSNISSLCHIDLAKLSFFMMAVATLISFALRVFMMAVANNK